MLKCYVDDSGSDPQPDGLFVLAGYVMEEARWEDFAEKWDAQLKRDFPVEYCRMSDAESGDRVFAGIDSVFRKRKVKDLASVVQECLPTPIACVMTWKDYNENVLGKVDPRLDNPYAILFFKILAIISQIQIDINERLPKEVKDQHGISIKPVEFIFDDQGPAGLKCLQWYAGLRERVKEPHRTMIGNTPQFKDDRELTPLQAADMLAWHIRRHHGYPGEDRSEVFGLLQPDGVLQYDVSPEELTKIADAFNNQVDPLSI
jgi:hypothetical protein